MREIKFRCWHPTHGMVYECVQWTPAENGEWLLPLEECNVVTKDATPMQYTGLKDKNGKDVYEGDIVQVLDWGFKDSENVNEDSEYGLFTKVRIDVVTLERLPHFWLKDECHGYEGEDLVEPEEVEVIGNIYEHPSLLESQRA